MYQCDLETMTDKIKTFSKFGDAGHGGITRYSLSDEAIAARDEFVKRMKAMIWQICMPPLPAVMKMQREL